MPARLPPGIITNSETVPAEIERSARIEVDDIARLWRAFAVNRNVRLENYFWRIWGNERMRQTLPGSTVARLFMQFSLDTDDIRTTPVPSPSSSPGRSSSKLSSPSKPGLSGSIDATPPGPVGPGPSASAMPPGRVAFPESLSPSNESVTAAVPERSRVTVVPPSILKKPRASLPPAASSVGAAADEIKVDENDDDSKIGPARAPRAPTPPKGAGASAGLPRKKKTSFVTTGASSRRRPATTRKRSSQSSTSQASAISSTPPDAQSPDPDAPAGTVRGPDGSCPQPTSSQTGSTTTAGDLMADGDGGPSMVERDFRARFAKQLRHDRAENKSSGLSYQVPSKSMAPLASSSAVAVAKLSSNDSEAGSQKGKGKATTTSDDAVSRIVEASTDIDLTGLGKDEASPLARTKSQLTLLLERDLASQGSRRKEQNSRND